MKIPTLRAALGLAVAVVAAPLPPNPRSVASERYREAFFANVQESDGTPLALLERMVPAGFVAVDVEVTDTFDQTPGPNAGDRR